MKFSLPTSSSTNHYSTKSKQWPQYMAVLTASLSAWAAGLHFAWPSPSLPILLDENYPLNITTSDTSYIVIMQPLGDIIGAPLAAALADVIGRKMGILLIGPPLFIGWIIIAFAQSTFMFCVGRFISGIGDGMLFIVFPMYVGEVTEPKVRGFLGCTLSVSMLIGMLMINCLGPVISIQNGALICSISPILAMAAFIWMPESPYYLLMKGKVEEARKSLIYLQRCDITNDLIILESDVKRQMSETGTFKDLIFIKSNRKALLIMIGIGTMEQVTGITVWSIFTQTLFLQANPNMSYVLSSIYYLGMQLVVTVLGSFLVDRLGRKPLIILSSFLCAIILIIGAIYFYLKEVMLYEMPHFDWVPLTVMIIHVLVFGFGLGTAPLLMLGEMFSASVKGKALCIMSIYYAIIISIILKVFQLLSEYGLYCSFLLFGLCCFLNVAFAFWFVPETKGKTLEEIQQYLKANNSN